MAVEPFVLRLPFSLAGHFSLARVLAADPERSWSEGYRLLEVFEVSRPEREFALTLLRRKTNLWLFRCNQRAFCGDFVVVNMSPPRPERRAAWVLELKQGAPLSTDGGGLQLQNAGAAVDEIVSRGVVARDCPMVLLRGSPDALLGGVFGINAA
jgi:hypothetical protein